MARSCSIHLSAPESAPESAERVVRMYVEQKGPCMRRYVPLLIALFALSGWLALGSGVASAGRFGPPWQSRDIVDGAQVYAQPDLASPVIGPLARGAIVVVTGEQTDSAGHEWTVTTLGYV